MHPRTPGAEKRIGDGEEYEAARTTNGEARLPRPPVVLVVNRIVCTSTTSAKHDSDEDEDPNAPDELGCRRRRR